MASTAVTKQDPAPVSVPALAPTPALEIDQNDVQLPRLKMGQPQSAVVVDGLVPAYSLYSTLGQEDSNPELLHEIDKGAGVLIHVLGVRKGKSIVVDPQTGQPSNQGDLKTWSFNDPDAHPEADTTYNYVLCLPEVDPDVPYKLLLKRTGAPAARNINTVLLRNADKGPSYVNAFRLTTAKKAKDDYRWVVPRVSQVEVDQAHVQAASTLAALVASSTPTDPTPALPAGDEPAI